MDTRYFDLVNNWFSKGAFDNIDKSCIIFIKPSDFLKCARPITNNSLFKQKMNKIRLLADKKIKFNTLPQFRLQMKSGKNYKLNNGESFIIEHNGRHRATFFIENKVPLMPVRILNENIEGLEDVSYLVSESGDNVVRII